MSTDARISIGLPTHPKTKKLIRRAGFEGAWCLIRLILWTAQNKPDGDFSGISDENIEGAVEWSGERGRFVVSLLESGYLSEVRQLDMSFWASAPPRIKDFGRACSKVWRKVRLSIFKRDEYRCRYCGDVVGPFECDHIVPISRGGSNDLENLATACVPCNRSKHARTPEEWGICR